jgi:suppressor of fused-like protein
MGDERDRRDPHDDSAPGWEAIDGALRPLYGEQQPKHYGTVIKWSEGGPDPLDGISAYRRDGGAPHWHFVSYGLTELYAKESDDREVSGYGFEFTFRLACRPDDDTPPIWAMNLLQNLARYVFQTGNVFGPGHHIHLNGPIALGQTTDICAAVFAADPELADTSSPHGSLSFLQLIGITEDELEAVQAWNADSFTELLAATTSPLMVTDLARRSILLDPEVARAVADATERDGSSLAELLVSTVRWERSDDPDDEHTRLVIDALGVSGLIKQLRGRTLHRRPLLVIGKGGAPENIVSFRPADSAAIGVSDPSGILAVWLPPDAAREMSDGLRPQRGIYRWDAVPHLEVEVVPTSIADRDGNVVRVVG